MSCRRVRPAKTAARIEVCCGWRLLAAQETSYYVEEEFMGDLRCEMGNVRGYDAAVAK